MPLHRHPVSHHLLGVGEILVIKDVQGSGVDIGRWEPTEIGRSGWCRVDRHVLSIIEAREVRVPPGFVIDVSPDLELLGKPRVRDRVPVIEHRVDEHLAGQRGSGGVSVLQDGTCGEPTTSAVATDADPGTIPTELRRRGVHP